MNGLVKFRLAWVLGFHEVENVIYVLRRITRERSMTALIMFPPTFMF